MRAIILRAAGRVRLLVRHRKEAALLFPRMANARSTAAGAADGLLTTFEVATRFRCRPQGVRELAQRRELPYYRIGRKMLFSRGDLEAFLASRRLSKD